jgi:hypothetical protein
MKKWSFAIAAFALLALACNNDAQNAGKKDLMSTSLVTNPHTANGIDTAVMKGLPSLDFTDTSHAFGNMHEGEVVTYDFAFKNSGNGPLIISSASGSCGCTVADFPKDAVLPGQGGIIKVKFNSAGKFGHNEKIVTITSNARQGTRHLYIQADIATDKKPNQ